MIPLLTDPYPVRGRSDEVVEPPRLLLFLLLLPTAA
jgi:hypothetical protein